MKIDVGNVWARVTAATGEEQLALSDYLSCEDTRYDPRRRHLGTWAREMEKPVRCLLDPATRKFPAGLAIGLRSQMRQLDVAVELRDCRVRPCEPEGLEVCDWLRDYQREAIDAVVRRGGRGILKAPTGSGKGSMLVALPRVYPCEWLAMVHRTDLVGQMAERYHKHTGEQAGTFLKGVWKRGTGNFTVASFQSVLAGFKSKSAGAKELVQKIQAINADEVHAAGSADTFFRVCMAFENAYYRIGQSGTPMDRGDYATLRMIGALGPLLHEVPIDPLIENGTLSKPTIRMALCRQASKPETEWSEIYEDLVVGSPARNDLICRMVERAQKPCMVFVDLINHGDWLLAELRAKGINAAFVSGKHSLDERKRRVRELVDGGTDVLLATVIFQEGIDVPELRSVVVATGKQSAVACLQRIGRGMRASAGKGGFEVWDVADIGQHTLEKHAIKRREVYEREGHHVETVRL